MSDLLSVVDSICERWRAERSERQARHQLDCRDFDELRDAHFLRAIVPADQGGLWRNVGASTRPLCEALRRLGGADSSVALVAAMHPAVIAFWLLNPDSSQSAWEEQRQSVFVSAMTGEQWGTITSEPGSGGDILRTRATATPIDGDARLPGATYAISGDKHFGSGSGICDRMLTTAIPEGESEPAIFVLDMRARPWDGSAGITLLAEWDGMGMTATQSHAMRLHGVPAVRIAWESEMRLILRDAAPLSALLFTAVILGILDEAIAVARAQLRLKAEQLRPYEEVEWSSAELDHWLAVQAYEGALRALEDGEPAVARHASLRAKQAVAHLAEQALLRLSRVIGGGTFSRRSPFAHWFEDVRALGFLRPPWGLAYRELFSSSFE